MARVCPDSRHTTSGKRSVEGSRAGLVTSRHPLQPHTEVTPRAGVLERQEESLRGWLANNVRQ